MAESLCWKDKQKGSCLEKLITMNNVEPSDSQPQTGLQNQTHDLHTVNDQVFTKFWNCKSPEAHEQFSGGSEIQPPATCQITEDYWTKCKRFCCVILLIHIEWVPLLITLGFVFYFQWADIISILVMIRLENFNHLPPDHIQQQQQKQKSHPVRAHRTGSKNNTPFKSFLKPDQSWREIFNKKSDCCWDKRPSEPSASGGTKCLKDTAVWTGCRILDILWFGTPGGQWLLNYGEWKWMET